MSQVRETACTSGFGNKALPGSDVPFSAPTNKKLFQIFTVPFLLKKIQVNVSILMVPSKLVEARDQCVFDFSSRVFPVVTTFGVDDDMCLVVLNLDECIVLGLKER